MASETLEEKTPDDGSPVGEGGQSEEERDSEMLEDEVSQEKKESMEEEEEEGSKKVTVSRKRGSKKRGRESQKSEEESIEKKKRRRSSSKEPPTPIARPVRERKTVERYSASLSEKSPATKRLSIEEGHGTRLKDIPNVALKLSKRKPNENLQMLHTILFGKKTKTHSLKRNINQFSGFVWVENEEKQRAKVREKLDKCVKEKLLDFCDVLDIPVSRATVKKEELAANLMVFLESPHATTDVLLADKEQSQRGRKHKKGTSTRKISGEEASTETAAKKRKQSPGVRKERKHSKSKEKVEDEERVDPAVTKDDSDEDDDKYRRQIEESDQAESEPEEKEDKPEEQTASKKGSAKKNVKKGSRAKNRDKSTTVTKGKGKVIAKAKAEPSREEIRAALTEILKEVDFNTTTCSDILRLLGTHFGVNLMHKKVVVKSLIKDVINNMTDEEDGEEAEENA